MSTAKHRHREERTSANRTFSGPARKNRQVPEAHWGIAWTSYCSAACGWQREVNYNNGCWEVGHWHPPEPA